MNEALHCPTALAELKTLTVSQLKSLCKKKGVTGYSKLTKDGIIRKLAPSETAGNQTPGNGKENNCAARKSRPTLPLVHGVEPESPKILSTIPRQPRSHIASSSASGKVKRNPELKPREPHSQPIDSCGAPSRLHDTGVGGSTRSPATVTKRTYQDIADQSLGPKSKLPRISTDALPPQQNSASADRIFKLPLGPLTRNPTESQIRQVSARTSYAPVSNASTGTISQSIPCARFKPLATANKGNKSTTTGGNSIDVNAAGTDRPSKLRETPGCLELPVQPNIQLKQITLPPSISKRKQAELFAIILSGVSSTDLLNCSLVSRLFRYSAHLSAYHRLKREFPGQRTEALIQRYNPKTTDMWPYLLQRQRELSLQVIYNESFLGKAVGDWYALGEHLWMSPDKPRQAAVAIRFILTRFYFLVSIHGAGQNTSRRKHRIIDCQEVVEKEIWTVSVYSSGTVERYHVLESTCEVIGYQDSGGATHPDSQKLVPRADWSSYISQRIRGRPETALESLPLIEHLKWTNREEYEKGISKHWLGRVCGEAKVGEVKIEIARRYILACVVENSISGKWMSSVEMAQEFAGLPSTGVGKSKPRNQIQLYIHEHHYVEGVHLESPKKQPLHLALAVVQTPAREYYILRDNGMQVGCEEDGVSTIWMSILGCRSDGTKV